MHPAFPSIPPGTFTAQYQAKREAIRQKMRKYRADKIALYQMRRQLAFSEGDLAERAIQEKEERITVRADHEATSRYTSRQPNGGRRERCTVSTSALRSVASDPSPT